jgi:hypothetical protein
MSTDERIKKITDIIIEWAEQKAEDGELKLELHLVNIMQSTILSVTGHKK